MFAKEVKITGIVHSKRQGVSAKNGSPWVSLTVKVEGRTEVEGEDPPYQWHSCYCVGHAATGAAKINDGDWCIIYGDETRERRPGKEGKVWDTNSVKVSEAVRIEPEKSEPEFPPPPTEAPPEDDDDLPF